MIQQKMTQHVQILASYQKPCMGSAILQGHVASQIILNNRIKLNVFTENTLIAINVKYGNMKFVHR